jgi:hypothetical protein
MGLLRKKIWFGLLPSRLRPAWVRRRLAEAWQATNLGARRALFCELLDVRSDSPSQHEWDADIHAAFDAVSSALNRHDSGFR